MGQTPQKVIADATTTTLGVIATPIDTMWNRPGPANGRGYTTRMIQARFVGGTSIMFTIVGNVSDFYQRPLVSTWETLAYRPVGSGVYVSTAITINAGQTRMLFLDPNDIVPWVSVNLVALTGGATADIKAYFEV